MPEPEPEPEPAPLTIDEMEVAQGPKFTPLPAALVARALRRPRPIGVKPKNDFASAEVEDDDNGHEFHQRIAAGSKALYDAILRARAA
jgi:hypothetical protein